jgi:hypothetical protein
MHFYYLIKIVQIRNVTHFLFLESLIYLSAMRLNILKLYKIYIYFNKETHIKKSNIIILK